MPARPVNCPWKRRLGERSTSGRAAAGPGHMPSIGRRAETWSTRETSDSVEPLRKGPTRRSAPCGMRIERYPTESRSWKRNSERSERPERWWRAGSSRVPRARTRGKNPTGPGGRYRAQPAEARTYTDLAMTRDRGGSAEDTEVPGGPHLTDEGGAVMVGDRDRETEELEFGSKACVCPVCGAVVPHTDRGRPCSSRKCPECGSAMKGEQCG